jgi:CBS domain-containing protein
VPEIAMKAIDIMTTDVVTISPEASVYEAARLLLGRRISALPVVDAAGQLVGLISESDLMRRGELRTEKRHPWWRGLLTSDLRQASEFLRCEGRRVSDVMSRDVIAARAAMPLRELAELMERHVIKRLPVLDEQRLVGIVSRSDLLRALLILAPADGTPPAVDDRVIRQRLLEQLKARHWAGSIVANVIVEHGIVHLWGEASTTREIDACRALAETVAGVRSVSSHMVQVKTVI